MEHNILKISNTASVDGAHPKRPIFHDSGTQNRQNSTEGIGFVGSESPCGLWFDYSHSLAIEKIPQENV